MKTYQEALKDHKVAVVKTFVHPIMLGTPEGDAQYWVFKAIFDEVVAAMKREGISTKAFNKEMKAWEKECREMVGK